MRQECLILVDGPDTLVELCGISILERLLRTLQRCGITHAIILASDPKEISDELARPSRARAQLQVTVRHRPPGTISIEELVDLWPKAAPALLVIRGDAVFDLRVLQLLSAQSRTAVLIDSAELCGAALLQLEWAVKQTGSLDDVLRAGLKDRAIIALDVAEQPTYSPALRRNQRPIWFRAPSAAHRKRAERVLLDATQKGSQDFPALIHAPIEKFLVRHLCKTPITPHQLSIAWIILAFATTVLFATGHLVWGIIQAFIVGILDGLDGKQARLKVEISKSGKLEHYFDTLFEGVWPSALAYYFYTSGQLPNALRYLLILLAAEVLDGIGKGGIYFAFAKLMTPPNLLDRIVRLIGGRRNIYLWVLVVALALGTPAKALIVMAWWEVATAIVDLPHAAWLVYRLRRTSP